MLKMFGKGGSDHPMADAKEAKRLLDELPAQDAKALEELAGWHESVAAADLKADVRIQRQLAIDEAAQARMRKLAREVLIPSRADLEVPGHHQLDPAARVLAARRPRLRPLHRQLPARRQGRRQGAAAADRGARAALLRAADQVAARALRAGRHRRLGRAEPDLRLRRAARRDRRAGESVCRRGVHAAARIPQGADAGRLLARQPAAARGRARRAGDRRSRAELRARQGARPRAARTGPTSRSPARRCARCASRSPRPACASSGPAAPRPRSPS